MLTKLSLDYPIVTVVGPRQAGKTTLVRKVFADKPYVNLEAPDIRDFAINDSRGFLAQFPDGAILDEIQRVPTLLSYLQVIVDESKQKGLFILTGSHQLEVYQAITQSLAGRTAILTLFPLSLSELENAKIHLTLDEYLLHGFYPRIYQDNLNPTFTYRDYFQTYIERDVRQIINVRDLHLFQRFIKLCAGRVGQIINHNALANELGTSSHTVKNWLSILEASFVIFQLQPYFENFGKRVVKSAKYYFVDVGLATYLLDIENVTQLARDPLRGHLFENLVVSELFKSRLNQALDPNFYFYRDNNQNEIDVLYKRGHELIPIEIKSSKTSNRSLLKNLDFAKRLLAERNPHGYLIYAGDSEYQTDSINILNYIHSAKCIE